ILVKARAQVDRSNWGDADRILTPLLKQKGLARNAQVAFHNLLGCAACLNQDFDKGVAQFSAAVKLSGNDPKLHQNLALAYEFQGQLTQAEPHWNRAFDLMDLAGTREVTLAERADYLERLLFEGLQRLAQTFSEKEKWATALSYIQRAHKLRPRDIDV